MATSHPKAGCRSPIRSLHWRSLPSRREVHQVEAGQRLHRLHDYPGSAQSPVAYLVEFRLSLEHQKVVHAVAFDEIVLVDQLEASSARLPDDDPGVDAVVAAVAVAIDDPHQRSWS